MIFAVLKIVKKLKQPLLQIVKSLGLEEVVNQYAARTCLVVKPVHAAKRLLSNGVPDLHV